MGNFFKSRLCLRRLALSFALTLLFTISCFFLALFCYSFPSTLNKNYTKNWNILSPEFVKFHPLNALRLEWEYFMIHDSKNRFTGSLGFVLADPNGILGGNKLLNLMPSGASSAIAGKFHDGERVANYDLFSPQNILYSFSTKNSSGINPSNNHSASISSPDWNASENGIIELKGKSEDLSWDLNIQPDWPGRLQSYATDFPPVHSTQMGLLPQEHWTVDMRWPRTKVKGTLTRRKSGEIITIDGHGYRENSWGKWDVFTDGWDFAVVSDAASGVQWAWQSYHRSAELDFLDLSFPYNGQIKNIRFKGTDDELAWKHQKWDFNTTARQCVPLDASVEASNQLFTVHARLHLGEDQTPMLSNVTPFTRAFFIMTQFPVIEGEIIENSTGKIVTKFQGQGGGEFAVHKSAAADKTEKDCLEFGQKFAQSYSKNKSKIY